MLPYQDYRLAACYVAAGYGKKRILSQIDFSVAPGEVLAIIGPNGAGKSTLLKSIAGQLPLLEGEVRLNGIDMRDMQATDIARQLSLLLTDRPSAELMSCYEIVSAGRYPYTGRLGVLSQDDHAVIMRSLEKMGAAELADQPFDSISDGQKQRVLLARALCQEPDVLLLDEPASFLDIRYQLELASALKTLARDDNLSIIVSLHELGLVRRCADRVLCLKDGHADRIGGKEAIFSDGYLEKLFSLPPGTASDWLM